MTATLEENVKNLKRIDSSNNTELASHVKIIVDSSQEVKDAMISLIKSTKTINKDATAVEEKVTLLNVNSNFRLLIFKIVVNK